MERIIIYSDGKTKLKGNIKISGSKNSALPILISTLLTDEECVIKNVPDLKDIDTAISLLKHFGKKVIREKNIVKIFPDKITSLVAPCKLIKQMRAGFLVSGPILSRYGKIKVFLPGGCAIGLRPVNIHLDGFRKLNAEINLESDYIYIKGKNLKSSIINLSYPSVGATENLIMASCLIKGTTKIINAAKEPEIVDLANFLNSIGAKIKGAGTNIIVIEGVDKLYKGEYSVISDRIEAGTFLIATALTGGEVCLENCNPEHLKIVISKLIKSGCDISYKQDSIFIKMEKSVKSINITTKPYPGFPTDLQAQWSVLMSQAQGRTRIKETIFENRFLHAIELQKLGVNIKVVGDTAVVCGKCNLSGASVTVTDLRAGAAFILAGLVAKGKTVIHNIFHLDRGYEEIEYKFRKLGAKIYRIKK